MPEGALFLWAAWLSQLEGLADDGDHFRAVEGEIGDVGWFDPDRALVFARELEGRLIAGEFRPPEDAELFAVAVAPAGHAAGADEGGGQAGFLGDFAQYTRTGFIGRFQLTAGEGPGVGGILGIGFGQLEQQQMAGGIGEDGILADIIEPAGARGFAGPFVWCLALTCGKGLPASLVAGDGIPLTLPRMGFATVACTKAAHL